jgi:ribosomal protein S27E
MEQISTKRCNKCGHDKLVCLRSTNEKICPECNNVIHWNLAEGQKSLITNNRLKTIGVLYDENYSKSS